MLLPRFAGRAKLIRQVEKACLETGFFYLGDACNGSDIAEIALAQMQRFFALDDSDPRKIAVDNRKKDGTYGWMPLYGEPAYQPGTVAHVESFDCGRENEPSSVKAREGRNVWPELPGFRHCIVELWNTLSTIGDGVLELIAESAGLERQYLSNRCSTRELNTLRLLHYPGGQSSDPIRDVGIAAHTDFECISLILQTSPGLELTDAQGKWYDAPARSDRLVVMLDDMLERWTNGYLKATGHRVRRTVQERFSVVMFIAVDAEQMVEPLPMFVSHDNSPRYRPITQRVHIDNEIRRSESYRSEHLQGAP
jgi:isopenicillin N synthase-like dioxygenase